MRFPREVTLDDAGGRMRLEGAADVDRVCRALNVATRTLEEIGQFDKGTAGDRATATLKDLGVWSERVQRIMTDEVANLVETVAIDLFKAVRPRLGEPGPPLIQWTELHEETKDRWRAYAIQVLDTEAVLG
jgi:hypothetical protein